MLNGTRRDQQIENMIITVKNIARAGIKILGYNWMPSHVWRTQPKIIRGGASATAFNYDSSACFDNGSCIAIVEGCTDSSAVNYNSEATLDDGSCYSLVWEYENTGGNATVLINVPENITINNEPIPLCATIGLFYTNDS